MTQPGQSLILLVGADPALEYLLKRYARESTYDFNTLRDLGAAPDWKALRPQAVWFSSLEVLAAEQALRAAIANETIPVVVCSAVPDDARATELGADYFFVHPLTYDSFLSTLAGTVAVKREPPAPANTSPNPAEERI